MSRSEGHTDEPLSVSAAVSMAKGALESIVVTILGEVSEVSAKAGYKAVYFTIKDDRAALPCMMWNNRYQASGVALTVGAMVELSGRFSLYAAKGRMNFEVFGLTLAGEGKLRMAVAALAKSLAAEGLMDAERKRPLPTYPETIGIVTSPRGAVIRDMMRTLRRRFPLARILVAGVPVEGANAAAGMVAGLERLAAESVDVILLGRGGGSFEDLMPFNDEGLARAIAASPVPIVSGIGHEPDTTIADMVADVRASTPTAAAETVAPDQASLEGTLRLAARRMAAAEARRLAELRNELLQLALKPMFQTPEGLFAEEAFALDELTQRLHQALPTALADDRRRLDRAEGQLRGELRHGLRRFMSEVAAKNDQWLYLGSGLLTRFQSPVEQAERALGALSPLAVLDRGYAIARTKRGTILRSVASVHPDQTVIVALSDGDLTCEVQSITPRLPGAEFTLTYSDKEGGDG